MHDAPDESPKNGPETAGGRDEGCDRAGDAHSDHADSGSEAAGTGLWDFSLRVYAQDGVAPACLQLQDRHGLDVNLLLFCCWAGHLGRRLQPAEVSAVHAEIASWHDSVVRPLRQIRQWMKTQPGLPQPEAAAALRQAIKRQELEAERIEQLRLAEFLSDNAATPRGEGDPGAAAGNLAAYLSLHSVYPDVEDEAALVRLLVSTFPELRPLSAFTLLRSARGAEGSLA